MPRLRVWWRRLSRFLRLALLLLVLMVVLDKDGDNPNATTSRILAATRGYTFDYVDWELGALFSKAKQELFGFHAYIPDDNRNAILLDYLRLQNRAFTLQQQAEAAALAGDQTTLDTLTAEYQITRAALADQQPLAEHIIEGQVSAVLQDEGFATLGQVLPPVTMHFLDIPDLLVVSRRDQIEQEMTVTLNPMDVGNRIALEGDIAASVPDLSVWITTIGGVGIWPSMIRQTDSAVIAFEITAHEWSHHYLSFFPLGLGYFSHPDTRIINETTASVFGDEIGNRVIERFYAEELAAGQVGLRPIPDYRALLAAVDGTNQPPPIVAVDGRMDAPGLADMDAARESNRLLADYLLSVGVDAQPVLDVRANQAARLGWRPPIEPNGPRPETNPRGWIHHTRVTTDYLLSLGRVEAAELVMENGRQHTGLRVLNQAWFAFNAGYQDNPIVQTQPDGSTAITTAGGGGDPIGAAIYEIRARSDSLHEFMKIMRGITTREELFAARDALLD